MARVRYHPPPGRRIVGRYVWERANDWVQDVDPGDVLGLLTSPGFSLDEDGSRLVGTLDGVSDELAQELLVECGIASIDDLVALEAGEIAERLSGRTHGCAPTGMMETVEKWQAQARDVLGWSIDEASPAQGQVPRAGQEDSDG